MLGSDHEINNLPVFDSEVCKWGPNGATSESGHRIAFIILVSYFVWFFADCPMENCHIVCVNGGRGASHAQWTPEQK